MKKDAQIKLVKLCEELGAMLILDECYCDLVWEGDDDAPNSGVDSPGFYSPLYMNPLSKNVIVVRGFSKVLSCLLIVVGCLLLVVCWLIVLFIVCVVWRLLFVVSSHRLYTIGCIP